MKRASQQTRTMTVAVVDDDACIRKGLSRLLRVAGFEVATYSSGEDFLDRSSGQLPGCLVLDIHLAGLSGMEVKSELERTGRKVPVIFLTADSDACSRVSPCFQKPFVGNDLIVSIRQALVASHEYHS